jgi:uncharacterized surface protein with fasciclin (FAS1) repeats
LSDFVEELTNISFFLVQTQKNCENDPEVEKIRTEIQDLVNERLSLTKSLLELQHQEDTITQNLEDTLRELEKYTIFSV